MLLYFAFITALTAQCVCYYCKDSYNIVPSTNITSYPHFNHLDFCSRETKILSHKSIASADIATVPIDQFSDAIHELSILRGWDKSYSLQSFTLAMNGEFAELVEVTLPILENCTRDYTPNIAEEVSDIVIYAILVARATNQTLNEVLFTALGTTSLSRVTVDTPCELRTLLVDMLCSIGSLNKSPYVLGNVFQNACRLYAHFQLDPNECLFKKIVYNEYKKKGLQQTFAYNDNRVISTYVQ